MAHFAKIDSNNIVEEVLVVANESATTETAGKTFIVSLGLTGMWVQTSYNTLGNTHLLGGTPFRKNYAGIGFTYDSVRDAFIAPKPVDFTDEEDNTFTFELNEDTCQWEAIPAP